MGIDKIRKTYRMGGINIDFIIADGVAAMTTNNHHVTEQLYKKALNSGKPNLNYNYRLFVFTEKFPGKLKEEIAEMIEKDMKTADEEGKKARIWASKQK
jgi:hypothetical protein